jgi:hypothetical protein
MVASAGVPPKYVREAPLPTIIAAWVLVADVIPEKGMVVATIPLPVIVPVQTKLPFEFVTVHPVEPLPPAISTSPEVSRIKRPVAQVSAPDLYDRVSGPNAGWIVLTVPFPIVKTPEMEAVLSRVVAPCRVRAPGVVTEPIVFIDEAPAPNVLVVEAPVPMIESPLEERVVNAPVPWVVTPIEVKLPAAGVPVPMASGAAQVAPWSELALMVPVPV